MIHLATVKLKAQTKGGGAFFYIPTFMAIIEFYICTVQDCSHAGCFSPYFSVLSWGYFGGNLCTGQIYYVFTLHCLKEFIFKRVEYI